MKIPGFVFILLMSAVLLAPEVSAQAPKLIIPKISSLDEPAPPGTKSKKEKLERKRRLRNQAALRRERETARLAATSTKTTPPPPAQIPAQTPPQAPAQAPAQAAPAASQAVITQAKPEPEQPAKQADKPETREAQKAESTKTEPPKTEAPKTEAPLKLETLKDNEPGGYSLTSLLLRTFGALLLVVGLIAASGWGLRKFGLMRQKKAGDDQVSLTVVNTVALGDKKTLQVVKFGERTLLIGSTSQGITLLAEEGYPEEVEDYVSEFEEETEPAGYFEKELSRASLLTNGWNGRTN